MKSSVAKRRHIILVRFVSVALKTTLEYWGKTQSIQQSYWTVGLLWTKVNLQPYPISSFDKESFVALVLHRPDWQRVQSG